MEGVKLLGFWCSIYSYRVIWVLKLKGIEFEYIEEDLANKSQMLLQYNPVHKMIPVLVHGGKPIAESIIILEYIEETWPDYPLLPKDAHKRAMARFWINFGEEKRPSFHAFFNSIGGEEQEKASKAVLETLKILEEQALGDHKFFGGETIDSVDIVFGWLAYWFDGIEEAVGVKLLEPTTLPHLHAWAENFRELPLIKENVPDRKKMVAYFKRLREPISKD